MSKANHETLIRLFDWRGVLQCQERQQNRRKFNEKPEKLKMAGKAAFIGVDVGTGSVRAALVSIEGQIIGKSNFYVHS